MVVFTGGSFCVGVVGAWDAEEGWVSCERAGHNAIRLINIRRTEMGRARKTLNEAKVAKVGD
jgi:hypothetical protein